MKRNFILTVCFLLSLCVNAQVRSMPCSGSSISSNRSRASEESHNLNGSAFGEGIDCTSRKSCSTSATSVRRILPSGAVIFKP